jgi:hypothetical protein
MKMEASFYMDIAYGASRTVKSVPVDFEPELYIV